MQLSDDQQIDILLKYHAERMLVIANGLSFVLLEVMAELCLLRSFSIIILISSNDHLLSPPSLTEIPPRTHRYARGKLLLPL